jgi:hypothetical protein
MVNDLIKAKSRQGIKKKVIKTWINEAMGVNGRKSN